MYTRTQQNFYMGSVLVLQTTKFNIHVILKSFYSTNFKIQHIILGRAKQKYLSARLEAENVGPGDISSIKPIQTLFEPV